MECGVYTLCRCNFALMILSELVLELQCEVDWSEHLPLMLHVALLGLDLMRPLVYEHSKALLGNLVIVVACKEDMHASLEARSDFKLSVLCGFPVFYIHMQASATGNISSLLLFCLPCAWGSSREDPPTAAKLEPSG